MKAALALILFATCAFTQAAAQDQSAIAAAESTCGPKTVNFDAKADPIQHPTPQPDADKTMVYVVEDLGQCPDCGYAGTNFITDVSDAVVKVGMDGSWVGAGRGASYLFFSTEPGDHHLCINWQSHLRSRSRALAFANLSAEAGHTYYFRARLFPGHGDYSLDLDATNADEGKFLVASSAHSVSNPKK